MRSPPPPSTSPCPHTTQDTDAQRHRPEQHPLRARPRRDPRRRQFARARLPGRRRHAALREARPGRLLLGRGRPALHRLHRLLGADDPGPRPSRGGRGRAARRDRGLLVRRADRARDRARRGHPRARALDGDGAPRELGHRGRDERAAAGARRHRAASTSSSSKAATTAMPTRCWSRRAPALRPSATRPRPACRPRWCSTRWCSSTTTSRSWRKPSRCTATRSPA